MATTSTLLPSYPFWSPQAKPLGVDIVSLTINSKSLHSSSKRLVIHQQSLSINFRRLDKTFSVLLASGHQNFIHSQRQSHKSHQLNPTQLNQHLAHKGCRKPEKMHLSIPSLLLTLSLAHTSTAAKRPKKRRPPLRSAIPHPPRQRRQNNQPPRQGRPAAKMRLKQAPLRPALHRRHALHQPGLLLRRRGRRMELFRLPARGAQARQHRRHMRGLRLCRRPVRAQG